MVTQQEAEALAHTHIQNYLDACNLDTAQDAGNALMKLCSISGVFMCASVGYEEAVSRMDGTAKFISTTMKNVQFKKELLN